jgi:hypothetical protein
VAGVVSPDSVSPGSSSRARISYICKFPSWAGKPPPGSPGAHRALLVHFGDRARYLQCLNVVPATGTNLAFQQVGTEGLSHQLASRSCCRRLLRQEAWLKVLEPPPTVYNRANRWSVSDQRSPKIRIGSRAHGFECCKMALIKFKNLTISAWNPAVFRRAGREHST